MPKDKTATNSKIISRMKEEFLSYGYEKASLHRISASVGITTAGLYKHFKNKEDMFLFLVRDTLEDFKKITEDSQSQMENDLQYNPFDSDWTRIWIDFIYEHYDGVKLLICCSKGSAFETFEEVLINMESDSNKKYAEYLRRSGCLTKSVTDMQWHILSTAYVHLIFEVVRHDMTKEEAIEHAEFISDLLYPGWKQIFGIQER